MADTNQNTQAPSQPQASGQQGSGSQQPQGPVAPSSDMYDPRLLVDVIKTGKPDYTGHVIRQPEIK